MSTLELSPFQKSLIYSWWKRSTKQTAFENEEEVFGIPLAQSLVYAHSRISYFDDQQSCSTLIPTIIAKCGAFLKEQAIYTEGIFRLSGNAKRIAALQSIFDSPALDYGLHLDWKGYTVHDASNILRRFLNRLPDPLVPLEDQALFKTTLADAAFPTLEAKIDAFQNLIERLPLAHQFLLMYLLDMLYLFSLHQEYTLMSASSLATAFSPVIFPDASNALNPACYKESQRVLEFLILHQDKFSIPQYQQHNMFSSTSLSLSSPLVNADRGRRHSVTPTTTSTTSSNSSRNNSTGNDNGPYGFPQISRSVTDLFSSNKFNRSTTSSAITHPTMLKRSNTAPSIKRNNSNSSSSGGGDGSADLQENRLWLNESNISYTSLNQSSRNLGRWKSIKRVVKEEGPT